MNTTDLLATMMLDPNEEYSPEINNAINMHNNSISAFAQGVTASAIVALLIKKGIVTETEFLSELESLIESSTQKDAIIYNRDVLLQCIEEEKTYMQQLQDMHEDLEGRVGTTVDLTSADFNKNHILDDFGSDDTIVYVDHQ